MAVCWGTQMVLQQWWRKGHNYSQKCETCNIHSFLLLSKKNCLWLFLGSTGTSSGPGPQHTGSVFPNLLALGNVGMWISHIPALEMFKVSLDGALSNVVQWRCPCPWQGDWNYMAFKGLSNPNHLMIPGFYESMNKQVTSAQECTQASCCFARQAFSHLWGMTERATEFSVAGVKPW